MLPSRKVLIALALLIVGIGALLIYKYESGPTNYAGSSDQNLLSVVSSSSVDSAASKIDSDGDGLPDWEETLYGTDPHNPDTDGDGTPDGKEIALGRNPLVKGPNDFLTSENNPAATSTGQEKLTLTDTFARNFFTQYMNMQQSGTQITADNASQVASDYLKNAPLPGISAKQYTENDLTLTDSDQIHLSNYQTAITAIFAKYWPSGETNEFSIMQQALVNQNANAFGNLTPIISDYQNILTNSLALSVPKLAVSPHLDVINSLAMYIQTLKMIQTTPTDPLSGLVGLNAFQNNYSNVMVSTNSLRMYFINSSK